MLKNLYKRILKKLNLSKEELERLQAKLKPENISAGPFIEGSKMCPNTTALSIKLDKIKLEDERVRQLFKKYKISNLDLVLFYLFFDMPSKLSTKQKFQSIHKLKEVVKELSDQKKEY